MNALFVAAMLVNFTSINFFPKENVATVRMTVYPVVYRKIKPDVTVPNTCGETPILVSKDLSAFANLTRNNLSNLG